MGAISEFFIAVGEFVKSKEQEKCYFQEKYSSDRFEGVLEEGLGITDINLDVAHKDSVYSPIFVKHGDGQVSTLSIFLQDLDESHKKYFDSNYAHKTKQAVIGDVVMMYYNNPQNSMLSYTIAKELQEYKCLFRDSFEEILENIRSKNSILPIIIRAHVGGVMPNIMKEISISILANPSRSPAVK